ncbi:MAG TPA: hypothetical protein VM073_05110 [Usitatibacter sp.]|nr:hypothetical protein [Usitatibacter sp.]
MQEVKRSQLALALALAAASPSLPAVVLGEIEARSALGEAFDARIPFTIPAGNSVDASCFALVREADDAAHALGEGVLTVERRRGEAALRLRTLAPVMDPVMSVRIRAGCRGAESATRVYSLTLAPRAGSMPAPITAATGAAAPIAQINAREGDTLESMAQKIHPRDAAARANYVNALRASNPALASQGPGEAIPPGTTIAFPDPRVVVRAPRATEPRIARTPASAEPRLVQAPRERPRATRREATPPAMAAAPAERPKRAPSLRPPEALASPPALALAPEAAPDRAAPKRPERRGPPPARGTEPAFVLKLSSSEVDLSRSRQIDDRMRAQLRERLLVLDADDQVAAMLSMRNSLRQLEARVAEMQLKLDAMPASLAGRGLAAAPAAPRSDPPRIDPPKAEPPKVALVPAPTPRVEPPAIPTPPKVEPKVEAPKVEAPRVEAPRVEPPKVEPPKLEAPKLDAPKVEAPKVVAPKVEPPKPAVPVESRPGTRPVSQPPAEEGLPSWLWAVALLLALAAAFIGWRLLRRRRAATSDEWSAEEDALPEPTIQPASRPAPVSVADEPFEVAAPVRPEMSTDAVLATRLTENSSELRRRYIEERFPEVQNRTVALEDPASVIKGARLFYEDGAMPRAVELLQFAIEGNPAEVRPWLALFEIYRLERLPGQFAELAQRFREHHGKGDYWRKVQFFGREIDHGNALYREAPVNTLETIGPREAKRLAAGLSSVGPSATFDPIAENWLNAPMDFENEVLANELRRKLMSGASLTEQDLQPNPMPALRSVEMFTVA